MEAEETEDTEKKHKVPSMDDATKAEETEKTEKAVSAPSSSSRLTGEQHRQKNKFVPDPRNHAEVRLRVLMDKKLAREARRKERRAAEKKAK